MTHEEILRKAIERAKANGYTCPYAEDFQCFVCGDNAHVPRVIFDHDFAKAFFGDEERQSIEWHKNLSTGDEEHHLGVIMPRWKFCLQEMALAEDRIAYLAKLL